MEEQQLPAFSWPTRPEDRPVIAPVAWQEITPEHAWGGSTGRGIRVCVVDSGVEADHPALNGMVRGGVVVDKGPDGPVVREEPHDAGKHEFAYADGLLYVHAWKGDVGLVEATPEGYREKGRFTPPGQPKSAAGTPYGDTAYSHPVIANGVLYIRDAGTLWAFDIKAGR